MAKTYNIKIDNLKIDFDVNAGANLYEALKHNNIMKETMCNGAGKCGKCLVQFVYKAKYPTRAERQHIGNALLDQKVRLACRQSVNSNTIIDISKHEIIDSSLESASGNIISVQPSIKDFFVENNKSTVNNQESAYESSDRMDGIDAEYGYPSDLLIEEEERLKDLFLNNSHSLNDINTEEGYQKKQYYESGFIPEIEESTREDIEHDSPVKSHEDTISSEIEEAFIPQSQIFNNYTTYETKVVELGNCLLVVQESPNKATYYLYSPQHKKIEETRQFEFVSLLDIVNRNNVFEFFEDFIDTGNIKRVIWLSKENLKLSNFTDHKNLYNMASYYSYKVGESLFEVIMPNPKDTENKELKRLLIITSCFDEGMFTIIPDTARSLLFYYGKKVYEFNTENIITIPGFEEECSEGENQIYDVSDNLNEYYLQDSLMEPDSVSFEVVLKTIGTVLAQGMLNKYCHFHQKVDLIETVPLHLLTKLSSSHDKEGLYIFRNKYVNFFLSQEYIENFIKMGDLIYKIAPLVEREISPIRKVRILLQNNHIEEKSSIINSGLLPSKYKHILEAERFSEVEVLENFCQYPDVISMISQEIESIELTKLKNVFEK